MYGFTCCTSACSSIWRKKRIDTVEVSYSLDCELFQETADGRYSLGASFALRHMGDHWRCEGDVGWSCRHSGWEDFESHEMRVDSVLESRSEIEAFVERVLKSQSGLIERQFADRGDEPPIAPGPT